MKRRETRKNAAEPYAQSPSRTQSTIEAPEYSFLSCIAARRCKGTIRGSSSLSSSGMEFEADSV
jgi:hypothetical protein